MALFESYERREPQILATLSKYGISSVEECKTITEAAGLDVYHLVEGIQPIDGDFGHARSGRLATELSGDQQGGDRQQGAIGDLDRGPLHGCSIAVVKPSGQSG